ncbi:MAG: DUF4071 domain-containing protein [Acidobacteriaceae bacterium]|nr:DUF4071 domain-containing protein [Acidobacteriaceae bacterium]
MEQEKICFFSMPFGKKVDPYTGREFDFDLIYRTLLLPAVQDAGYQAVRGDQFVESIPLRPILERIIRSQIFVADLTTANPNVLYELGLRHGLSNGATVLVMASGTQVPFDISFARPVLYTVDYRGNLIESNEVRRFLSEAIRQGVGRTGSDSPVYTFFPELHVEMPSEFLGAGRKAPAIPKQTSKGGSLPGGLPSPESLKLAEQEVGSGNDIDPTSVLETLRGYQATSAWEDLIRFANELPEKFREMPQVQQMTALALNRLGRGKESIALISSLIARTGGDAETYGILGRIYKGLYAREGRREYLDQAIASYRSAFKLAPNDFYSGINLVSLLSKYGGVGDQNELNQLIPILRDQISHIIADPRSGYWDVATAFELAVIAHDWPAAHEVLRRMLVESKAEWMLETTAKNLQDLGKSMAEEDQAQLQSLVGALAEWRSNA